MRKACLLAGVALIGGALVVPEVAGAETLEEVLTSAYDTNPTLQARRARLRAADEGVPQALANWRPTVTLSGEAGRGKYESNQATARESNRNPSNYALSVSQPLYRGGRTTAQTQQAEATVMAERALLQATEQSILLNAATAYLNVVRDEAVLKLNVNNEQVLRRQLEAAQERFRVGEITRTDVSQAEARLSRATADRVAAEGALQNSRANFINVVGRPPEAPQAPQSAVAVPASFDEVKAVTLAKNPNVIAADWTASAAKEGIDLVFGELLPTVSLNGQYSRAHDAGSRFGNENNRTESENMQATLNVSVPLYEGGGTYSRVRAQKHTYGQRRIEADQARRDSLESATRGWEDLQAARARIRSYESQIRASEMALAGVEEEAKVGSRTVLDVLDAEQELFDARVNMVRAQHDEMVAAFQVKSALGQMTAEGLALSVDAYDPTKHYEDVRNQWIGTGIEPAPGYND